MELTRGAEFDRLVEDLKQLRYVFVWLDLQMPKVFCGQPRYSQVLERLRTVLMTAKRNSIPIFVASNRHDAWETDKVQHLVQLCGLQESRHQWCALGINATLSSDKSSVVHRIASLPALQDTPCRCPPDIPHVNEVALIKQISAHRRGEAEQQFVQCMIATALPQATRELELESKNPADSKQTVGTADDDDDDDEGQEFNFPVHDAVSSTEPLHETDTRHQCPSCHLVMFSAHCQMCETELTMAYPTEERLAAAERRKRGILPKRKKKEVEQHFDDCGDSLKPLNLSDSDESEENEPPGLSQSLSCWSINGSSTAESPEITGNSYLACDIEEMLDILERHPGEPWPWGVEIVEICGGRGLTSWFVVKRRLRSGHNFDIVTGTDLTNPATQRKVCEYVDLVKPLVIVMAPICAPYSPLGRLNQVINQDAWHRSLSVASPIAKHCGVLAKRQLEGNRHFLVEQPVGSTLFQVQPWPAVVKDSRSLSLTFDQCQVGQTAFGYPAKKRTELIASARELLEPFVGKTCPGNHSHQVLTGAAASQAQRWPVEMCQRIAFGIEQLVRNELKCIRDSKMQVAYPSIASGTSDAPEDQGDESWRKCRGCLWRLHKHDVRHTRVPGECKHPEVEAVVFDCAGCTKGLPRASDAHTYGPDCRHALTSARTGVRKRPHARVRAEEEPTSKLAASRLGQGDRMQLSGGLVEHQISFHFYVETSDDS